MVVNLHHFLLDAHYIKTFKNIVVDHYGLTLYCGTDVRIVTESLAMIKTKKSTVHHVVEAKRWELSREKERITYPPEHTGPVQMNWRTRENYSATDLDYRGRSKI